MPKQDDDESELHHSQKVLGMVLVPNPKTAEVVQPGKQTLDLPTPPVPTQRTTILSLLPVLTVRSNHLNPSLPQPLVQSVAVVGFVSDQPLRLGFKEPTIQSRFDKSYFVWGSTFDMYGDRKTRAVCDCHDLGPLAPLGFADFRPPFLAGTKVPSTKPSSHRICSRSWSWARKARHSFSRVPSMAQRCRRSWTVLLGPYRRGNSLHCAPVHKIQRMPSKPRRSSAGGRPPRGFFARCGKCSLIFIHCSSESLRQVIPLFVPLGKLGYAEAKSQGCNVALRGFRIASSLSCVTSIEPRGARIPYCVLRDLYYRCRRFTT